MKLFLLRVNMLWNNDVPMHVPEQTVLPHATVHPQPAHIPIVQTNQVDWPIQPVQHVVQHLVPVQAVPLEHVVQEVVAEHDGELGAGVPQDVVLIQMRKIH